MENVYKTLAIIVWPVSTIIIVLIFYRPLRNLINRIKGIKGAGYGFDADPTTNKQEKDMLLDNEVLKIGSIKKGLNLYSEETRRFFQEAILTETDVDKIKDDKERSNALQDYAEALYVIIYFERIYNSIFGSQIRLLNHLNSSFNESPQSVKQFYDGAVSNNPEVGKYPYTAYLEFLEGKSLVKISDDSIQISWLGRDFLKFMVQMGLTDSRHN